MLVRADFTVDGLQEVQILAAEEDEQRAGIRLYERLRPALLELDRYPRESVLTSDN